MFLTDNTKTRRGGGRRCRCYEIRKDKVEEIETSLTLGGLGEVVWGEGRGEGVDATLMSYTLKYISLTDVDVICQVGLGCDNR